MWWHELHNVESCHPRTRADADEQPWAGDDNVTTMAAEFGMPGLSAYGASKAAVKLLTKTWAAEYGPKGVRVNAVSPGPTNTRGTDAMGDGFAAIMSTISLGRVANSNEIAEAIVFLASGRASYINGATIHVDGGRVAV